MTTIQTCLWYDTQAEEAARFYVSLLPDSRIRDVTYYGAGAPMPEGTVLTITFDLAGRPFMALNGGSYVTFNEAHSMLIECETQDEIDRLWDALLDGGSAQQCGWLKDRYGLSWQIVPASLQSMLTGGDKAASDRVMAAMMGMVKLDSAVLEKAYRGN